MIMPNREKRTTLRTVRLTVSLDELLRKDAGDKNMNVNALIYSVLEKYAEWDRSTEHFGFIEIQGEIFGRILELCEDDKLAVIAQELGARIPKETSFFWFKEANLESLLKSYSLFSKYSQLYHFQIKVQEEHYTLIFSHKLGEKWSRYLQYSVGKAIKSVTGVVPENNTNTRSVVFKFRVRQN